MIACNALRSMLLLVYVQTVWFLRSPSDPPVPQDVCSPGHRFPSLWTAYFLHQRSRRAMSYADKTIACRDCGTDFVFTAGEQEFYAQKGFTNEPTRCPSCRKARKSGGGGGYGERDSYGGGRGGYGGGAREMHTTTCASCGKE